MAVYDVNGIDISGGGGGGTTIHVDATDVANIMSTGTTNISPSDVGLSSAYVSKVISNYNAFFGEVSGSPDRIPLIIHTDQHGRLGTTRSGYNVLRLIGKLVNWYEISKILNLGDTCSTTFNVDTLSSMFSTQTLLFPYSKQINVFGNHDTWDERTGVRIYHPTQELLEPYFYNLAKRGGTGWFSVIDDRYMVKYVALTNYQYKNNSNTKCINTDQANFLIRELSADDGYDIILLSHEPLQINGSTVVNQEEAESLITGYDMFSSSTVQSSFLSMIAARKQKTSGTFTDSEGISHSYDFSNVSTDILMAVNGHTHVERYHMLTDSIMDWSADWIDDDTFYFAYIDKKAKKFKRWKTDGANLVDDVVDWSLP